MQIPNDDTTPGTGMMAVSQSGLVRALGGSLFVDCRWPYPDNDSHLSLRFWLYFPATE